jgi:hypothetical protein
MRNYDNWVIEKAKLKNKDKIVLFLSWIFYKTFDTDAKFLSDKFWFKIKQTWGYKTVWFPKNVLEKYLFQLKQKNYWYLVFDNIDWKLEVSKDFIWWNILNFSEENIVFLDNNYFSLFPLRSYALDISIYAQNVLYHLSSTFFLSLIFILYLI